MLQGDFRSRAGLGDLSGPRQLGMNVRPTQLSPRAAQRLPSPEVEKPVFPRPMREDTVAVHILGLDAISQQYSMWNTTGETWASTRPVRYSIQLSRLHHKSLNEYFEMLQSCPIDSSGSYACTPKPSVLQTMSVEDRRNHQLSRATHLVAAEGKFGPYEATTQGSHVAVVTPDRPRVEVDVAHAGSLLFKIYEESESESDFVGCVVVTQAKYEFKQFSTVPLLKVNARGSTETLGSYSEVIAAGPHAYIKAVLAESGPHAIDIVDEEGVVKGRLVFKLTREVSLKSTVKNGLLFEDDSIPVECRVNLPASNETLYASQSPQGSSPPYSSKPHRKRLSGWQGALKTICLDLPRETCWNA
ncbi:MAG: uncharacterized protein KVP18_002632 [Porospora cf. gigantea A]|uniref:uncharacterized protein n=2 Tax=Porospora cf. gigantea A TaxID=2853593 RepID=UPI00355A961B|nr:MAG: hypothetical protein KVP18_002632 [Porospora cf. gigantea A]